MLAGRHGANQTMAIKLGIHAGPQDLSMDELRKLWRIGDDSGFHWISVWDHFYANPLSDRNNPCFEGIATMAGLASMTQNVRVGCLVFCALFRSPGMLAKAATTIDHLSGGRLEIGLGAGWHEMEYAAYGIPFHSIGKRMDILEEGIQVVRLLTTQDRSDFDGEHFQLVNAANNPKPIQKRPNIWVGGNGERRTLRITARHADGWNSPYTSPEEYKRLNGVLDAWCEKEGRDPATIERNINLSFHMAADESGRAASEANFRDAWGPAADVMRERGVVVGTPDQAIDLVGRYQDAGAARVNIAIRPPADWDALRAWSSEVISAF